MSSVAVIAHSGKNLDGGLPELRKALERHGVADPLWFEVPKSSQAPKQLRAALEQGADLIFVWGGDGMVQRCVDVVAGTDATIAILPAGTANLFASNLGIPKHIDAAVEVGLTGERRKLDVGRLNREMFAVMAGVGFDARVIRDASPEMKRHFGRSAYVWAGAKNLHAKPFGAQIVVDGRDWYEGQASLVLFGNVGMRSPESRHSPTLTPTTVCSRSASAAPTASFSGGGPSHAAHSAAPRSLASCT